MSFLYGGEEGDAGNHPCNRDEVWLSDSHHADKDQEACQFVGFWLCQVTGPWHNVKMFNLDEIDKKELRYDIALDVIDENDERKSFMFDVYTRLQIIS